MSWALQPRLAEKILRSEGVVPGKSSRPKLGRDVQRCQHDFRAENTPCLELAYPFWKKTRPKL